MLRGSSGSAQTGMSVLLNASRRCWMADREIGVPGAGWPQRVQAGFCATKCVAAMPDGRSGDRRTRGRMAAKSAGRMSVLLNASWRCWMADREIGVPGGRMAAKSAGRNVCATKCVVAMRDGRSGDRRARGPDGPQSPQTGMAVLLEAMPRRRFGDAWIVYFSFLKGIKTGGEASASTSQTWRFRK